MCHPGLSRECLRWRAEPHHPGRESAACVLTFFSHETLARRCFDLLARACAGLRGCRRCVPYCASVCRWIEPWTKRFLSPKAHFKFRGVMHSLQAILDLWQIGPWSSPVLVLLSLIVFSSVLCPLLLQTLVGAWWARASACLLADPTMSGRLSWSETGSTHRLCATYCCWTTQSRPSKSM